MGLVRSLRGLQSYWGEKWKGPVMQRPCLFPSPFICVFFFAALLQLLFLLQIFVPAAKTKRKQWKLVFFIEISQISSLNSGKLVRPLRGLYSYWAGNLQCVGSFYFPSTQNASFLLRILFSFPKKGWSSFIAYIRRRDQFIFFLILQKKSGPPS